MQTVKDNDKQYCPHGILRDAGPWACVKCGHEEYLELSKIKNKIKNLKSSLPQTPTNLRSETRGDKRKKEDELRLMSDIFSLSANGLNDLEIMKTLKLANSTYYRIKTKLYEEAKTLWQQTCSEGLEYIGLQVIDSPQKAHKVNNDIAQDNNQTARDRSDASFKAFQSQLYKFMLIRDGPLELMKQQFKAS